MSGIMKVFLLLAVMVYISEAQLDGTSGKNCLCRNVRNAIGSRNNIKDIQINPATLYCDQVEIVVTLNSGLRYCLNPRKPVTSTTARPTELTATPY
ncbi:interleukin-8-like [Anoplopoma fimbria]|uniref:interleukin-8-like n=1 Tax=Anoplopoma fimbria TaxID=229290 RepID=UPI0023EC8CFE|nr:interleukin-8-like [Anoplopoma fimbria]